MKQLVFILVFLHVAFLNSQENLITKDSLSIVKFVGLSKAIKHENITISFSKVIQDSRCPKDVMCVRAGEADIELKIKIDGEKDSKVLCRIDASGFITEANNLILETDYYTVYAFALTPYPKSTNPIAETSYTLEIVFKPKKRE